MSKTFKRTREFFRTNFWKKAIISLIVVFIIFCFFVLGGSYLYMNRFLNSRDQNYQAVEFSITNGESVRNICKDLENKGLIKNDFPLLVYLKLTGQAGDLKAGEYLITSSLSPIEIIDILTKGKVASRKITIPEGWNNNQIGEYLEKQKIVKKSDFLAAANKNYDYWFLVGKPANVSLEGFLFPDTYQVSLNATADQIVEKMLINFNKKINNEIKLQIENSGMNAYEIVTMASIVEQEVAKPEDRKVVAGIFEKRLEEGMPLQSDATIKYILSSNKIIFSYAETRTPSPYNTYLNTGLPLGPVCNPGLESIKVVLSPTLTDYLYFLSADGVTYYSKTLEQHETYKAKYLQ